MQESYTDVFGSKEILKLVFEKLTSQILIFGLVCILIVFIAYQVFGKEAWPLIAVFMFVFCLSYIGYLFFEQKKNVKEEKPATMNKILSNQLNDIENINKSFSIKVWATPALKTQSRDIGIVEKQQSEKYSVGDKIQIHFTSVRDCYLTLLNVGTSGKLSILFPNALHVDNFVKANTLITIPDANYSFEYELQGPGGLETLKAIATLNKLNLTENDFSNDGAIFKTSSPKVASRDIAIIRKQIDNTNTDNWSEETFQFKVV